MTILDEIRSAVREVRGTGCEPTMVVLNVEADDQFRAEVVEMLTGPAEIPDDLSECWFEGLRMATVTELLAPRVLVFKRPAMVAEIDK